MTELSADARKLLQAGRTVLNPDPHEAEAVRAALLARVAGHGSNSASLQSKSAAKLALESALKSGVVKVLAASLIVTSAIGYAVWPRHAAPAMIRRAPAIVQNAAPTPIVQPAVDAILPEGREDAREPEATPAALRSIDTHAALRTRPAKQRARGERNQPRHLEQAPSAAPLLPPSAASSGVIQSPPMAAGSVGSLARADVQSLSSDNLSLELQLLRRTRSALEAGHSELAIQLSDQYQVKFPHGALREEQLALRALALCALGRLDAGRAVARRVAELAPGSPHLTRLDEACRASR